MDQRSRFDAVLVPGGGVREGGELPAWVKARLDKAREVAGGSYIITLTAGTTHKAPPLDRDGMPLLESVCGAQYLVQSGYPAQFVLTETASYDTIGNAYFARTIHTDPAGWRKLLIVNSEFHMPRTEIVFRWMFGLAPVQGAYELTFLPVADAGMDSNVLAARRKKEEEAMERLRNLTGRYRTLAAVHKWLFSEHSAYSVADRSTRVLEGAVLQSY